MKHFLFYIILLLILYVLGFIKVNKDKYEYKFFDKTHTKIIKGIAILLVVTVHVGAFWSGVGGLQFLGGVGVALFLICSGYGLYCSYENNGINGFFNKKIIKIYMPFLFVELLSIPFWNNISLKKIVLDLTIIRPVSSFAWYMNYLIICYILFYFVMLINDKKHLNDNQLMGLFMILFSIWFVLDSTIFLNPDIPMLKSRQMLSFIFGIYLAQKKVKEIPLRTGIVNISAGVGMMIITQLPIIKKLPLIEYNLLSLGTVFPLAIGVLAITYGYKFLFKNKILFFVSIISYEIYLIHQYSINILTEIKGYEAIIIFATVTIFLAYLLHLISDNITKRLIKVGGERIGRFNSSYID